MSVTTSKQFSLNISDVGKGLIMAVLTPALLIIYNSLQAGSLTFDWKQISTSAGAAGVAYLLKNFMSAPVTTVTPPATTPGTTTEAEVKVIPPSNTK